MRICKKGKIDISELNTPPEKHEYETAKFFAKLGYDILFIGASYTKGQNNPDFSMAGRIWETKSPTSGSKTSIEHNIKKATKQSSHIIFDLRRLNKKDEINYLKELEKRSFSPKIRTLLIITIDGRLLDLKGNL